MSMSPRSKQVQTNRVNGPDQHRCSRAAARRPRGAVPGTAATGSQERLLQGHLGPGGGLPSGSWTKTQRVRWVPRTPAWRW